MRLLVVDDDEVDRMAIRRTLRNAGLQAEVVEADSVAVALELIGGDVEIDAVLLDFNLPGGDGMRVLEHARSRGFTAPIIVLTGQGDDETAVRLMKAGASDYLTKGALTPERLEKTLTAAIRLHQAENQARETEYALRQSEARFRILHETSPDGFMIFRTVRNETGEMVDALWEYVNPAAERLAGMTASELIGRRLLEVMPAVGRSELFGLYREVVETGESRQIEIHFAEPPFDTWVRVTAARLEDGFAISYNDISARKRAEAERERALSARNRFYAAMSHEIRTPMNAILGYSDLLLLGVYGELSPKQREGIERTHRAALHLLDLVNDVLDLSKIEAGKLSLQMEEVRPTTVIRELLSTVAPLADDRAIELRFDDEACDSVLSTDPRRLRQILLNLLSNALKFGSGKPVLIRCFVEGAELAVEVRDHGPGIAPEDVPRIYEEFVQLDGAEGQGTGLGLPISKRLAELLGGRMELVSEPGAGSAFTLRLPLAMADTRAASRSNPASGD